MLRMTWVYSCAPTALTCYPEHLFNVRDGEREVLGDIGSADLDRTFIGFDGDRTVVFIDVDFCVP